MEKPEEGTATMIERVSDDELLFLKGLVQDSGFSTLTAMFKERLERRGKEAFKMSPSVYSDVELSIHFGRRDELEILTKFVTGLESLCNKEIKRRNDLTGKK